MLYILKLWIFFGALVASKALDHCKGICEDVTLITISASLKSQVFLPCHFGTSLQTSTTTERVEWSHFSSLLKIAQNGIVFFNNPREGRVNVFPNLAYGGNFSIVIQDLQLSDLGTYCCELSRKCWKVEITESPHPAKKNEEYQNAWLFFFAGAGIFTLLFIAFICISKFSAIHNFLLNWTRKIARSSKCNSSNEEHKEAFRKVPESTLDLDDCTTSIVYYVNQEELHNPGDNDKSGK
ncbi:uncharacterized protein LOC127429704 [Myxocyprinus asiaticus]|uniref:uncharacterized protein LOC127429704 n=1 Tax=Myxocyprinus asiaticus TaxID=70543 RepID=UPI00222373C9|nr:uncharacterized protein LOC127429704 [Myxocyprinus asiaticus]